MVSLLALLVSLSAAVQAKEIAFTFDDSPRVAKGYLTGPTRAKRFIKNLKEAGISEAAFFSVSSKLDQEGTKRLKTFSKAGHIIANHTHTHPDLNQMSLTDYVNDFKTADSALHKYSHFEKWFRFPYLREGDTAEKRDGMRAALSEFGYNNAYVTVNNYDWYMEDQFQREIKKNPKLSFTKLKSYYVVMLVKAVEYYDEMAIKHLGRSPKHVILLHETDLNALFISDLAFALRNKGWKIISPREAYQDEISKYKTTSLLKFNPGRIGEIARDKGQLKGLWHESCDEEFLEKEFAKQVLQ